MCLHQIKLYSVDIIFYLCTSFANKYLMHSLFHNMWDLLPQNFYTLGSVVMLYDGLTMIDMIDSNQMNTVHFLQVSKFVTFVLTCLNHN